MTAGACLAGGDLVALRMCHPFLRRRTFCNAGSGGSARVAGSNVLLVAGISLALIAEEDCNFCRSPAHSDTGLARIIYKHPWQGDTLLSCAWPADCEKTSVPSMLTFSVTG